jgi:Alg9-like mannosyltransferase family
VIIPFSVLRLPELVLSSRPLSRSQFALHDIVDTKWLPCITPALVFVCLYSCLGHKEIRFLFPAFPLISLSIAIGLDRFYKMGQTVKGKRPSMLAHLAGWACTAALLLTFVGSCIFVAVSHYNYPGGDALIALSRHLTTQQHALAAKAPGSLQTQQQQQPIPVHVFLDVATAMTGVSLFGQRAAGLSTAPFFEWTFHKAGYEETHQGMGSNLNIYTHIITENADEAKSQFRIVQTVQGSPRFDYNRVSIQTSGTLYILEKNGWPEKNRAS